MGYKNFSLLDTATKSATFNSDSINIKRDVIVGLVLTTSAQASLNVSVQLQVSMDGTNRLDSGSAVAITTNTLTAFTLSNTPYAYARLESTFTAGNAAFQIQGQTKGWV